MEYMVLELLFHLALTLVVEMLIYGLMDNLKLKSFIAMFAANVTLNLGMNITVMFMKTYYAYYTFLLIAEISVFIIEAGIYYFFTKKPIWYCLLASLAANASSLALGVLANHFNILNKNGMAIAITVINFLIVFLLAGLSAWAFSAPRLLDKNNDGSDSPSEQEHNTDVD